MAARLPQAIEQIRLMEARIEKQTAAIKLLERAGQDTSDAVRRLTLLEHELEKMRLQPAFFNADRKRRSRAIS